MYYCKYLFSGAFRCHKSFQIAIIYRYDRPSKPEARHFHSLELHAINGKFVPSFLFCSILFPSSFPRQYSFEISRDLDADNLLKIDIAVCVIYGSVWQIFGRCPVTDRSISLKCFLLKSPVEKCLRILRSYWAKPHLTNFDPRFSLSVDSVSFTIRLSLGCYLLKKPLNRDSKHLLSAATQKISSQG